jgi:heat shock protein HtpX
MLLLLLAIFSTAVCWFFWLLVLYVLAIFQVLPENHDSLLVWLGLLVGVVCVYAISSAMYSGYADWLLRLLSPARKAINREKRKIEPLLAEVQESVKKHCGYSPVKLNLMAIDSPMPNAFALGKNTIAVSRGLYEKFDDDQICAVLAHEMGHLHNKDSRKLAVTVGLSYFTLLFGILSFFAYGFLRGLTSVSSRSGNEIFRLAGFMFGAILIPLAFLFLGFFKLGNGLFTLGLLAIGRKQEFKADNFACKAGYGQSLLDFFDLIKNYEYEDNSLFAKIQRTHPSIMLRIDNVENQLKT